jgi:hypothetical protein
MGNNGPGAACSSTATPRACAAVTVRRAARLLKNGDPAPPPLCNVAGKSLVQEHVARKESASEPSTTRQGGGTVNDFHRAGDVDWAGSAPGRTHTIQALPWGQVLAGGGALQLSRQRRTSVEARRGSVPATRRPRPLSHTDSAVGAALALGSTSCTLPGRPNARGPRDAARCRTRALLARQTDLPRSSRGAGRAARLDALVERRERHCGRPVDAGAPPSRS